MALITSRLTPKRVPGALLICRSKLNFTSSAVSSPKPLWNWTPRRSLNVHTVPSGEIVQLSARSGSTSAVVTLPSLMAKRVSPRNMKRAMAWLCPRVLEWGSRVSGSLAAMFTTFFCASATDVSTKLAAANTDRSTRDTVSQTERDIDLSPFAEQTANIATCAESNQDARMADTIYESPPCDKGRSVALGGGLRRAPDASARCSGRAPATPRRPSPATD